MTTMKNSIHDNANGLDYTLVNDHYLPNLTVAAPTEQHPTGRWGCLHKRYLKEHHPIRYNQLLLSGELGSYLAKLDKQAEEQLALIIRQMQEAEGVDEALKAADQLEWVRRMNSIRNRAEETILREIVFNIYKNQAFA
ncbi:TnpV protein [Faecalibacterium prausnitzii]